MLNRNQDIKKAKINVPDWAVAEKLGISENSFYRWIRKEIPDKKKAMIMQAIREVQKEIESDIK
ncbi:hypothetical protein [Neobacillus niacini]|uniref:hypothetical protein n=1 Tax=Neobacillus niacini TaxID=86668 RepID=UPI0005ED954C|nr:hypothetical protein [Neobacillus niacini]